MATEIEEGHQTLGVLRYMGPLLVLVRVHMLHLYLIVCCVETHDLLTNGGCTTISGLVAKVEHLLPGRASTIIHDTLGKDTNHSALS